LKRYQSLGSYNPITNPLPFNIQNPYIIKEIQKGSFKPTLGTVGILKDNSILLNFYPLIIILIPPSTPFCY